MATSNQTFGYPPSIEFVDPLTGNRAVYHLASVFFNTAPVVPAPAPVENVSVMDAPEWGNDDDYVDAETGELLPPEMQAAAKAFVKENEEDEAVRDWEVADEARLQEEMAHVAELLKDEEQASQALKEDVKQHFLKLIELNNKQMPLYKACVRMRWELKNLNKKNPTYWRVWNEMIAHQKEWLSVYETMMGLVEIAEQDKDFDFQALAAEWNPDKEFEGDYKQLYKEIVRNFTRNIQSDGALHVRGKAVAVAGADKPAPPPATLGELMEARLAKEAAGGGKE